MMEIWRVNGDSAFSRLFLNSDCHWNLRKVHLNYISCVRMASIMIDSDRTPGPGPAARLKKNERGMALYAALASQAKGA